ncbi:alpha/beta fold hydrolase [Actinokineospora sp. NPDC004072]
MPITAVLVHSPFLGPASLRPLADALAALGHPAVLPDLRPSVVTPPVHQRLIGAFADVMSDALPLGPVALVGHSGAGPLLPAFAEQIDDAGGQVSGLVYLDAGLPTPGLSWRETVPAELYAKFRAISPDGLLPRWPAWFPDFPVDPEIAEEAPEVPIAFLKEPRPSVDWDGPSGYVRVSPAYADDLADAQARGWPTRSLDLDHLAPATHPGPTAAAVLEVLLATAG